jgi:hypothetical protein
MGFFVEVNTTHLNVKFLKLELPLIVIDWDSKIPVQNK